jgi:hypothetical protein
VLRAVPTAPEDELAMSHDRRTIAGAALVVGLVIATVGVIAVALLSGESDQPAPRAAGGAAASTRVLPTMAPSPGSPVAEPTPSSTGDVAASQGFSLDFDMLPTGGRIGDWRLSGDGDLEVAAVPTAVSRSARLDARSAASACLELDVALGTLSAAFMLDAVGGGGQTLLTLRLDDSTTIALTLADNGAIVGDRGTPVPLAADSWYAWVVSGETDGVRVALLSAADALLAEARSPGAGARATEFCMAVQAPMRVYLDQLTVEAR